MSVPCSAGVCVCECMHVHVCVHMCWCVHVCVLCICLLLSDGVQGGLGKVAGMLLWKPPQDTVVS